MQLNFDNEKELLSGQKAYEIKMSLGGILTGPGIIGNRSEEF